MYVAKTNPKGLTPSLYFYVGLLLVMLALWIPFIPNWLTFVHSWRVEIFAAVVLFATLTVAYRYSASIDLGSVFSRDERIFVVLPMLVFIGWSAASTIWALSWKSAIHHTLVWSSYLIFYCIVRYSLENKGQYKKYLGVFVLALLLCALPAIAGHAALLIFGGSNTLGLRFSRFTEQAVTLLPLLLIGVVKLKPKHFVIGLGCTTAIWLLVFCSMSRAGIFLSAVATVATGVVIFAFRRFMIYRLRFAIIVSVMIMAPFLLNGLTLLSQNAESSPVSRFSDQTGLSNSNDFRKLMISLALEMAADHPIVGIGADNFGFQVHQYRELYAAKHPNDPSLAQSESDIPERAHNEYLQILSELGIVGAAIFAWFLTGIGIISIRALKGLGKQPIHASAAIIGLGVFLAGALVTSYSFRLIQNGFVFFFVLAVAVRLMFKRDKASAAQRMSNKQFKLVLASGLVACLMLTVYCGLRVSSVILTERANTTWDLAEATRLYCLAEELDTENPFARNSHGMRLLREQNYAEAVPYLNDAISMGLTPSDSFSYLATAQSLAGDAVSSEETMRKASVLYPRSVFVGVRYSLLLRENGKTEQARAAFENAIKLDNRVAKTWKTMITRGFQVASSREASEKEGLVPVMELQPANGVYAVLTERLIKFPEEQRFSMFRATIARSNETQPIIEPQN